MRQAKLSVEVCESECTRKQPGNLPKEQGFSENGEADMPR